MQVKMQKIMEIISGILCIFAVMKKQLQLEALTQAVCEIARRAGAYIREERLKFSLESVERKHAHDYVSYVDKGSERLIVSALRELLPEAGFITEEGTAKVDDSSNLQSPIPNPH